MKTEPIQPTISNNHPTLANEGAEEVDEEFNIEDMLIKIATQCQKLEREWIAARYVSSPLY